MIYTRGNSDLHNWNIDILTALEVQDSDAHWAGATGEIYHPLGVRLESWRAMPLILTLLFFHIS